MSKKPLQKPSRQRTFKSSTKRSITKSSAAKSSSTKTITPALTKKPLQLVAQEELLRPMPKPGTLAPAFTLPSAQGSSVSLKNYRGQRVVLYFYPKDDTPGCTIEAQGFRDEYALFATAGAVVIGISKDTCESHRSFAAKYNLPFLLLSDVSGDVVRKYGCWVKKKLYGREYMGIARATFVIDENGVLQAVFPNVSPQGHSKEVLHCLQTLSK